LKASSSWPYGYEQGEKPYTAKELYLKFSKLWKLSRHWKLVSLGRGVFEFQFSSLEDMRMAWAHGTTDLIPGESSFSMDEGF